jgi:hypothetical protein
VKEFASKMGISYGCAASDPEVKKAYYGKKADDILKEYKAKKPVKKPVKAEPVKAEPKKEVQKEMPEVLQKMIQDFARPRPPTVIGSFTTNYEDYYAIMTDGSILSLLKRSKKPILFRKEKSVKDAWKWLKKNVRGLEYHNYTYNMLTSTEDPFITKYGLTISDPPTEIKMLFYISSAGETLARRLAEEKYETPESKIAKEMRELKERERDARRRRREETDEDKEYYRKQLEQMKADFSRAREGSQREDEKFARLIAKSKEKKGSGSFWVEN